MIGLLHDQAPSVRRWSLNALALIGTKAQLSAIRDAVVANRDDADIFAAGVSALAAVLDADEARTFFHIHDMPLEGGILFAAAQQNDNFKQELRQSRVDIDYASAADLRLVGLLIGLGKAPENLFSLNHKNAAVIGALNGHDDRLVAQYSVWATYENPKLGLRHLRIPLKDIEAQRPNVRKYIYRLITSQEADAKRYYEQLVQGSRDSQTEVREGLAVGIKDLRFDGLDQLVLDWFVTEENDGVRQALLEHMAANADVLPTYRQTVIQSFESARPNSLLRARLEAASHKTDLYRELKLISLNQEQESLFGDIEEESRPLLQNPSTSKARGSAKKQANNPDVEAERARVLVVVALPKELAAFNAMFDTEPVQIGRAGDPNIYSVGSFPDSKKSSGGRSVLVTSSGMGNDNSSSVAANALRTFSQIEHIVMVGIAGGCPNEQKPEEHVRLGDVVTSTKGIIGYDNVKATTEGSEIRGSIQAPSARLLAAQRGLEAGILARKKPWIDYIRFGQGKLSDNFARPSPDKDVLHNADGTAINHPNQSGRVVDEPLIHGGVIGAADTLQKDPKMRDHLRDALGVRAIEMEASGLQTAAWAQSKDIFVIRGICDYCDAFKNNDWQEYAALVAAAYARALIEHMPSEWFPD
ncbi:hypothetical protein ACFQY9_27840 [Microvirga aerilata]|uniref:5'-methylthioadenosine/S-adenosylhomocysteine nucleosidase family protein n=1 Tax=Microvirga aerilata TaxID=670292 RepID=UPI003641C135